MTRRFGLSTTVLIGAAALAAISAYAPPAAAQFTRPEIGSPLRAGTKPGCRWVEAPAKEVKVCDARKVCRIQTVPAQRIWTCGTERH